MKKNNKISILFSNLHFSSLHFKKVDTITPSNEMELITMNQNMKLIIQKAKPIYYQLSQLTPEQQIIARILHEVGARVSEQALVERNKNLFVDKVKYVIKKMKHNRPTFKLSLNQVKKIMKKLKRIGYM
jgi:hypothetical protein